jgi:pyridoxine 5-phosphate synthase
VELHTGAYCEHALAGDAAGTARELARLEAAAIAAAALGLEVHAGHGLTFNTVGAVARIPRIAELNIGHFLIGEAIFTGLGPAVAHMRVLIGEARKSVRGAP